MTEPTNKIYYCPIEVAVDQISGKWKPLILHHLRNGGLGLEEIGRRLPLATRRMLNTQLRELEKDGLIERQPFDELPPPIEYGLTATGYQFLPILDQLRELGCQSASRSGVMLQEELDLGDLGEAEAIPPLSEAS
ncbi:MAG: helix-turn-helix domain-containing protein [Acidobacteriota bacterium]